MDVSTTLFRLNSIFYSVPTVHVPSPLVYLSKSLEVGTMSMARAIIVS